MKLTEVEESLADLGLLLPQARLEIAMPRSTTSCPKKWVNGCMRGPGAILGNMSYIVAIP